MRLFTLLLAFSFAIGLKGKEALESLGPDTTLLGEKYTNVTVLVPNSNDPKIVNIVGEILQRSHFKDMRLDDEVSSRFLDRYLDALDPQHFYFLQSDLEEFESYRSRLDELILEKGDARPARVIFNRFRTRLDQQYDYVIDLLKTETFTFESDDRYLLNRKEAPRPSNLAEARELWKQRLRYEYLQEKLNIGRPEAIADIVAEKLEQNQADAIAEALEESTSPEKAEVIQTLVEENLKDKPRDEIVQTVLEKLEADNAKEIVKIIAGRYNRILRSLNDYDNDDVLQIYLTSLAHVYDPHSDYMGGDALENFAIGMKLSLFGIGALLRSEDGYCKIVSLTPNGPAENSKKLNPNDKIIAVAQGEEEAVDVVDMPLRKVVNLIRGAKGTEVRLTIVPADAPDPSVRKTISLVRDEIKLEDQQAKAMLYEIPDDQGGTTRLGVIDLPSFYSSFELQGGNGQSEPKSTTSDVAKLIKKLEEENVAGIVLDLRRNGGGSLEEAINLTGLFIKEGPVVQVKDPNDRVFQDRDPDPAILYDGPLAVMTSRFSASASEILAGALQDYGRAVVVGDITTHGKGTVQSLVQLAPILQARGFPEDVDPGALKFTIRKFYRASGASTQLKGVEPDIVLPSVNNHADVGESSLPNALKWDTIQPAEYEKMNFVTPHLSELAKLSEQRVAKNEDFAYIREEIERYRAKVEEKTVSLNMEKRLQEKKEVDDRRKARREELASRPKPPGKVYEITLADAIKPGLPEPGSAKADESDEGDDPATADEEEAEADAQTPAVDVALEETKRILEDLIALTSKTRPLTAATSGSSQNKP